MLSVTGLPIAVQGALSTDVKKKILVANHITSLDPFILDFLHPDILVSTSEWSVCLCFDNKHNPGKKNICIDILINALFNHLCDILCLAMSRHLLKFNVGLVQLA